MISDMYYGKDLGRTWAEWWAGEDEEKITDVVADTISKEIAEREKRCEDICEQQRSGYVLQSWAMLFCGVAFLGGYFLARRLD